jgi:hypothetical protein
MRKRPGVSLVELLVVMSLSTIFLTTSAVVLHRLMQSQGKTRDFFAASRNGLRLADQFRSDVHRARSATTDNLPAGVILRLQLSAAQAAEYQHLAGVVRRTLLENDQTVSREEFVFPAASRVEVRQAQTPRLLSLSIIHTPGDEEGPAQQSFATAVHLLVEAQPGRDRRYTDLSVSPGETP